MTRFDGEGWGISDRIFSLGALLRGVSRGDTVCAIITAIRVDQIGTRRVSNRDAELAQAIQQGTARMVERGSRVTGYTTDLGFFGHSTAETKVDMQSLIASAESFTGPEILVLSRNSALLRWCLANGLRVVQPMTLMSTGLYHDPAGAWLPSIVF